MLAWGQYNYIHIIMQVAYVLLGSRYFISYKLSKKYLMQQPVWTDIKANMFYYFPPHGMNTSI